jgi:hypothetical protein
MSYTKIIEDAMQKTFKQNGYLGDLNKVWEYYQLVPSLDNAEDTLTKVTDLSGFLNTQLVEKKLQQAYMPYQAEFLFATRSTDTLKPKAGDVIIKDNVKYSVAGVKKNIGLTTLYLREESGNI